MANPFSSEIAFRLVLLLSFMEISKPARVTNKSDGQITQIINSPSMQYHNGPLLNGNITVNLIWYGKFEPNQRAIVTDFINSINKPSRRIESQPDVVSWWKLIQKYYNSPNLKNTYSISLSLGTQIIDDKYSLGKKLTDAQIDQLAAKGAQKNAINVVLTSADVTVDGFCTRCGKHGSGTGSENVRKGSPSKYAYIWVGNPKTQCPGQCAWPFYQPMLGPRTRPAAISPNKDVGMEGVIINLGIQLAGTVTNPFRDGFYKGTKEAPVEAGSACERIFARGAYPGFAGDLLIEVNTGASYNAQGVNGRKYLLPAIFDPKGSFCSTLV